MYRLGLFGAASIISMYQTFFPCYCHGPTAGTMLFVVSTFANRAAGRATLPYPNSGTFVVKWYAMRKNQCNGWRKQGVCCISDSTSMRRRMESVDMCTGSICQQRGTDTRASVHWFLPQLPMIYSFPKDSSRYGCAFPSEIRVSGR